MKQSPPMKLDIPEIRENASADAVCYPQKEADMANLRLPGERVENWQEAARQKLDELIERNRALKVSLDTCVRCGACANKCQFFMGSGDPYNMPVARAELLRKFYRRHHTLSGKLAPNLSGAQDLDEELLEKWYTYFYQCSMCRRCSVFCPYGIDTAEITWAAREIMASIGVATKYVTEIIAKVYNIGNNLGIPEAAWRDSAEFLESELKDETGLDIEIPVNRPGVEVLLVPPSADFFTNPDTTMGYAKIFHAAGISWTTSSYASEGGNYGMFFTYRDLKKVNKRLPDEAKRLGVKKLVIGECGHAWRAAQAFTNTINGPLDFLDPPRPQHIGELTVELLRDGVFDIDPSRNDDLLVTLHDPCNLARAGNILEEPREIIRAVCNNFIEMPRNTIRENTFCCGGGGGLLADEIMDIRMGGVKPRADAVKVTGANVLAVPCAICKANLPLGMEYWDTGAVVMGVSDLLSRAMRLPGQKETEPWPVEGLRPL